MMTAQEIADKLREQWRPYHAGRCYILSKGDECDCHLCLIDKLMEIAKQGNTPDADREPNLDTLEINAKKSVNPYTGFLTRR